MINARSERAPSTPPTTTTTTTTTTNNATKSYRDFRFKIGAPANASLVHAADAAAAAAAAAALAGAELADTEEWMAMLVDVDIPVGPLRRRGDAGYRGILGPAWNGDQFPMAAALATLHACTELHEQEQHKAAVAAAAATAAAAMAAAAVAVARGAPAPAGGGARAAAQGFGGVEVAKRLQSLPYVRVHRVCVRVRVRVRACVRACVHRVRACVRVCVRVRACWTRVQMMPACLIVL